MHVGERFEIPAKRRLRARKSLSGAAVMLNIIIGDDIPKSIGVVGVERRHVAFDQRRAGSGTGALRVGSHRQKYKREHALRRECCAPLIIVHWIYPFVSLINRGPVTTIYIVTIYIVAVIHIDYDF